MDHQNERGADHPAGNNNNLAEAEDHGSESGSQNNPEENEGETRTQTQRGDLLTPPMQNSFNDSHVDYIRVTTRNAKCDQCEKRNTSIMQKCTTCGMTTCGFCHQQGRYDRRHNLSGLSLDWTEEPRGRGRGRGRRVREGSNRGVDNGEDNDNRKRAVRIGRPPTLPDQMGTRRGLVRQPVAHQLGPSFFPAHSRASSHPHHNNNNNNTQAISSTRSRSAQGGISGRGGSEGLGLAALQPQQGRTPLPGSRPRLPPVSTVFPNLPPVPGPTSATANTLLPAREQVEYPLPQGHWRTLLRQNMGSNASSRLLPYPGASRRQGGLGESLQNPAGGRWGEPTGGRSSYPPSQEGRASSLGSDGETRRTPLPALPRTRRETATADPSSARDEALQQQESQASLLGGGRRPSAVDYARRATELVERSRRRQQAEGQRRASQPSAPSAQPRMGLFRPTNAVPPTTTTTTATPPTTTTTTAAPTTTATTTTTTRAAPQTTAPPTATTTVDPPQPTAREEGGDEFVRQLARDWDTNPTIRAEREANGPLAALEMLEASAMLEAMRLGVLASSSWPAWFARMRERYQ